VSDGEERAQLADLVEQLEHEGMALDKGGDASGVHLLFRTVHNLKSLAAYMGLKDLAATYHRLEDGLDAIRRGREPWTAEWLDRVFQSIDEARAALGEAAPPRSPEAPAAPAPVLGSWGLPLTEADTARMASALLRGLGIYRLEKLFKRGLAKEDFETLPVMEDVAEQGELIAIHPAWEAYAAGAPEQVVKFLFASAKVHEELSQVFFDPLLELQAPEPPAATTLAGDAIRCLVIEDDAATGALLAHILKRHGACMVAGTARAGYAEFLKAWERAEPYHILFLDLRLPDLSGLAILSAVRKFEAEHHLPHRQRCMVLICTSSSAHEDIMASLAREADGYLVKPVSPEAIEEKIALIKETWLAEN
jgi:CheY-like chemotaxis protein/HPt (histidine-containing phosphotransfer) domain-containing protein